MSDVTAKYTAMFDRLRDATGEHGRLVVLGYGTLDDDGKFVLRADLRALLETAKKRVDDSLAAGATRIEALTKLANDAEAAGVTRDGTPFVVYSAFHINGHRIYIGETTRTCAVRWMSHGGGACPFLAKAIENTEGGKRAWTCRPIIALPEGSRSKDLLLYFEEVVQRHLGTVGTSWGLNLHYGRGLFGGVGDDDSWRATYEALIGHLLDTKKWPSRSSADPDVRKLGEWVGKQRTNRESLPTHRAKALEALKRWKWHVKAAYATTAKKIDMLLVDPVVIKSKGWDTPKWSKLWVRHLRRTFNGEGNCVMTSDDRARIHRYLPCLTVDGNEAKFRYRAKLFATMYLNTSTGEISYPKQGDDRHMYMWIMHIRDSTVDLTQDRITFLESLGIGHIGTILKPQKVQEFTRVKRTECSLEWSSRVSKNRKRTRLADEQDIRDSIIVGTGLTM